MGVPLAITTIFSPEEIVADRYRIVCMIGHGGMGEVYEVEDLALHEHVALKTIRSEMADTRRAIERFKREIQLARKVTHPNVCRIFELGSHHRQGTGEAGGKGDVVTFLTMELLHGETLRDRLRRAGRMTLEEALPIVLDMASALGAAHKAGIVHRDFKTANVILVPPAGGSSRFRTVVTDFGLAKTVLDAAGHPDPGSLTENLVGTPAYMAPEQIEGRSLTSAADIYAFGIVMYEMVTGTLPFGGETPMSIAVKRLTQPPISPQVHVKGFDHRWEAAILMCLQVDPAKRFATTTEVAQALGESSQTTLLPPTWSQDGRRKKLVLAAVALAVAVIVLVAVLVFPPTRRVQPLAPGATRRSTAESIPGRRCVAILGFRNLSGRPGAAWLSTAFSEMLSTELASGGQLRVVPGETVARSRMDLSLPDVDSFEPDTLSRIRKNLGTHLVVVGSYMAIGEGPRSPIRLDFRIQDTEKGETIHSEAVSGTEAELFDLVTSAGSRIRGRLGLTAAAAGAAGGLRTSFSTNPEAARLYAEGLASLRSFDALVARRSLEKAVAADPDAPLAHSALAQALSELGYESQAQEEATRAFELSGSLSREDHLLVEGRSAEIAYKWEKAAGAYAALFALFPDDVDTGLALARTQANGDSAREALSTLARLRQLAPEDPRIDLAEAEAAFALLDYERSLRSTGAAVARAEALGARFLVSRAHETEAAVYLRLGETEKAMGAASEMKRLASEMSDRGRVLGALHILGIGQAQQGHLSQAEKTFAEGLEISRAIGNEQGAIDTTIHLGELSARRGDLAKAGALIQGAMVAIEKLDQAGFLPWALTRHSAVLEKQGDLVAAEARAREAIEIASETDERAEALFQLAGLLVAKNELAEARKNYESVLEIRKDLGEKRSIAQGELALAALSLEEGEPAQVESRARGVMEEFRKEKALDDEATALAVLARALAVQSRTAEARDAVSRAASLSEKSEDAGIRLGVAVAVGRVTALTDVSKARQILERASEEAKKVGFAAEELEARLALGEVEASAGDAAHGRANLEKLAGEARSRGFLNVAAEAERARRTRSRSSP